MYLGWVNQADIALVALGALQWAQTTAAVLLLQIRA